MEVVAKSTIGISPRKVNLAASAIRRKKAITALTTLMVLEKRAGGILSKTLKSAMANAINNNHLMQEELWIKQVDVTPGMAYKRFRPSTRGRVHPYKKRTTHITIVLTDNKSQMPNNKLRINTNDQSLDENTKTEKGKSGKAGSRSAVSKEKK